MDALKNRVGAFTEGIVTMACPVLLAVALNKTNSHNEGSGPTGCAVSLAVANLITCLCAFILLVIANMLKPWNQELLLDFLYGSSKLLVHLCAVLQNVLAYMILVIKINFQQSTTPLVVTVLFCLFPLWWCIQSVQRGQMQDKDSYDGFHDKLDQSLDILASVTSFLFQMLVALALESQAINGQGNSRLCFTFVFCLFGTCFMLAGAVLGRIQYGNDDERKKKCDMLCMVSQVMCGALALLLTVVMPMLVRHWLEWAVGIVFFPWISVGAVFLICQCKTEVIQVAASDEAKPAPLGLTKAMFAAFLVVLIPTFSTGATAVSGSTKAFIIITAGVVISGLLWRLLTHLAPMKEAAVAADFACLLTLVLVMAAAVSFVLVATNSLARGNITCQTPCNSSHQMQDSILNCFKNMTEFHGTNWTSVVSSVSC